ncbi:MAG: TPM domain-containing protein [Verrucomicrobia bacterium]|nr:TPM domain-containing protein [Verrucomicrobiota bacterium]
MRAQEFLNQLQHDDIVAAIRKAEGKTSGEIRVLVSHKKLVDPMAAAQRAFLRMGMTKTKRKNAVLIFVAPRSRNFAIIGDQGVHSRCGDAFWRGVRDEMTTHFRKAEFTQAILHGIRKAGDLLAQHFPRRPDDRNELSEEVAGD